ncbi:hypothetical protein Ciccas_003929 [Cichlidogyrus casuarinus]|uniref:Uncharacterized protein n=1 Tax=Cichlidogyrus casuarinus TaxID=1844966 RepID=A0ABD2QCZ9_9PLAT
MVLLNYCVQRSFSRDYIRVIVKVPQLSKLYSNEIDGLKKQLKIADNGEMGQLTLTDRNTGRPTDVAVSIDPVDVGQPWLSKDSYLDIKGDAIYLYLRRQL